MSSNMGRERKELNKEGDEGIVKRSHPPKKGLIEQAAINWEWGEGTNKHGVQGSLNI